MGQKVRRGFYFCTCVVGVVALQFVGYLLGSLYLPLMDFGGWAFFLTSCVSHAASLALPGFLLYALLCAIRLPKVGTVLHVLYAVLLSSLVYVNGQVFLLYHFHINGFVVNMITGPAAAQIFNFDVRLYARYAFLLAMVVMGYSLLWWFVSNGGRIGRLCIVRSRRSLVWIPVLAMVASTLFAHLYHIYASFYQKQSVMVSATLLPYYFPTTSYSLMTSTFGLTPPLHQNSDIGTAEGDMQYPLQPIRIAPNDSCPNPNVLLILIDSWNSRALTHECMPHVFDYAVGNQWFQNHMSCSNGTRSSVFGLWFGLSSYYWNMAESSHTTPVVLDVARTLGYTFHNYPSAPHTSPPFGRVLFGKEKDVRIETPGNTTQERDKRITDDFIAEICNDTARQKPFLAFIFYDAPHNFELPQDELPFQPTWLYADYASLDNDTDPTPFWNLYRNVCHATDKEVGRVLAALDQSRLSDNTLVIITGDHSQEFNENKKNYWGHNGNFSWHQIGVPLIMHDPRQTESHVYRHRTTHYDVVPTIMRQAMNVENPEEDYSMGHQLTDSCSRNWHIVGSELNYAFIIQGDTILEKTAQGSLNVFDSKMNMVTGYHFNAAEFNEATRRLNRFIKKD